MPHVSNSDMMRWLITDTFSFCYDQLITVWKSIAHGSCVWQKTCHMLNFQQRACVNHVFQTLYQKNDLNISVRTHRREKPRWTNKRLLKKHQIFDLILDELFFRLCFVFRINACSVGDGLVVQIWIMQTYFDFYFILKSTIFSVDIN